MAPLNVDPGELVGVAAQLADFARAAGAALPAGWVPPAGADPVSAAAVPRLNAQAAALFNGVLTLLDRIQRTASDVGASAQEYTRVDDDHARAINGGGAPLVTNPVGATAPPRLRTPPGAVAPMTSGSVDPLVFAEELRAGPGPGPAMSYADAIRNYAAVLQLSIANQVGGAAGTLRNWTPVGTAAADLLERYRGQLSQLAAGLRALADGVDTYGNAFAMAKARHPAPQEIKATRKELVTAIRSKSEPRIQKALTEFQEQKARSAETVTGYSATVEGDAVRNAGAGAATSVTAAATGGGAPGAGGGAGDTSMLTSLLPSLMSAMGSAGPLSQLATPESEYDQTDYGYDYADYAGLPDYSSAGSPGLSDIGAPMDSGAGIPDPSSTASEQFNVAPMPSVTPAGTPNSASSPMPRAPVIEPLAGSPTRGVNPHASAPMMPYMPMAPGMGPAGGGNERNRVVAWHPDRLMYVDDTPHTEPVIGERPTIAPTVTPPTPVPAQNPPQTGGTA
ncbi:PPE domain-containing protein [Nocardia brasiliensis]|uniref:PPE domain-containing protein n=1 Tax=Nocardia brasiliensis TaxID=37326 RepID=UPI00245489D8|nr:PPE domain-containing protein [Nocardia brasiliensis]